MRKVLALTVSLAVASLVAAAAQGQAVTYNPAGTQVLIDPGTGQQRVVPPLLMPGEDSAPIRLRKPAKHHASPQPASSAASEPSSTVASAPPPRHTPRPAPAPQAAPQASVPNYPAMVTQTLSAPTKPHPAPPPRTATAAPPQHPAPALQASVPDYSTMVTQTLTAPPRPRQAPAAAAEPQRSASLEPAKPRLAAGKKRETVTFAAGASDPSTSAVSSMRNLAGELTAALADNASRVQIMAYAGAKGEKSSDMRRLSLKRALVIRQLLIDDGVPSERIDVYALGGADDSGPADRVDIFVKS